MGEQRSPDSWQNEQIYYDTFRHLAREAGVVRVGVVNLRWALRGELFAALQGKYYDYIDLHRMDVEDVAAGSVIIYDPLFFTTLAERYSDPEQYPALAGLPDAPPEGWELLFMVQRLTHDDYPVSVYRVRE